MADSPNTTTPSRRAILAGLATAPLAAAPAAARAPDAADPDDRDAALRQAFRDWQAADRAYEAQVDVCWRLEAATAYPAAPDVLLERPEDGRLFSSVRTTRLAGSDLTWWGDTFDDLAGFARSKAPIVAEASARARQIIAAATKHRNDQAAAEIASGYADADRELARLGEVERSLRLKIATMPAATLEGLFSKVAVAEWHVGSLVDAEEELQAELARGKGGVGCIQASIIRDLMTLARGPERAAVAAFYQVTRE